MKKTLLIFVLTPLLFTFSGCGDDNDDEIEDLQNQINDLNNQLNSTNNLLQTGQPITVSFSGNRGFDSAAYSYSSVYDFAWDQPSDGNSVDDNGNGTYDFYIDRYSLVEGSNEAEIIISNYNPTTGINNASITVYAQNYFQQSDTSATLYVFQTGYLNSTGVNNITVNSFSYNTYTRAISLNLTINATEANPYNPSANPAVVNVVFSGTLTNSNVVFKQGVQ